MQHGSDSEPPGDGENLEPAVAAGGDVAAAAEMATAGESARGGERDGGGGVPSPLAGRSISLLREEIGERGGDCVCCEYCDGGDCDGGGGGACSLEFTG